MSDSAKGSIILIGFSLIFLFLVSTPSGGAVFPEHRLDWVKRFQIEFKIVPRAKLVLAPKIIPQSEELANDGAIPIDIPKDIRGIYLTSWSAGSPGFIDKVIDFAKEAGVNAIVIDVKDDSGQISYSSEVDLAIKVKAALAKFNPEELLQKLKRNGIYPIARIVAFKDPLLAKNKPDLAVKDARGGLWQDRKGLYWVDPHHREVWDYNIAIAKEAARKGFAEIQFDYIRFTSDGYIAHCRYPAADGRSKVEVISGFLKKAAAELHQLGVRVSADVFGLTCSAEDDLGIGQNLEAMATEIDVICPMVYPSHFYHGQYQLPDPDREPYQTVRRSLEDARKRLESNNIPVVIRPWLQDFSLKSNYNREQIQAQIRAVRDAGLKEWIFWNPGNRYQSGKYRAE